MTEFLLLKCVSRMGTYYTTVYKRSQNAFCFSFPALLHMKDTTNAAALKGCYKLNKC